MSDQDARGDQPATAPLSGADASGRRYLAESLPADWSSPQPRRSASTPSRWDDEPDDDDLPLDAALLPASNPAAATAPLGVPVPSGTDRVAPTRTDAAASGEATASLTPGADGEVEATGRPRWPWAIAAIVLIAVVIAAALKLTGAW